MRASKLRVADWNSIAHEVLREQIIIYMLYNNN